MITRRATARGQYPLEPTFNLGGLVYLDHIRTYEKTYIENETSNSGTRNIEKKKIVSEIMFIAEGDHRILWIDTELIKLNE